MTLNLLYLLYQLRASTSYSLVLDWLSLILPLFVVPSSTSHTVMQSKNGSSPRFDVGHLWSISGTGKVLRFIEYHMECEIWIWPISSLDGIIEDNIGDIMKFCLVAEGRLQNHWCKNITRIRVLFSSFTALTKDCSNQSSTDCRIGRPYDRPD